jgi:hypothetical protein
MKVCVAVEVPLYSFLTSKYREVAGQLLVPTALSTRKESASIHGVEGWMGLTVRLDDFLKTNNSYLCR